jgi:hypothetical protein
VVSVTGWAVTAGKVSPTLETETTSTWSLSVPDRPVMVVPLAACPAMRRPTSTCSPPVADWATAWAR